MYGHGEAETGEDEIGFPFDGDEGGGDEVAEGEIEGPVSWLGRLLGLCGKGRMEGDGDGIGILPEVASATALPRRWLGYNSGG